MDPATRREHRSATRDPRSRGEQLGRRAYPFADPESGKVRKAVTTGRDAIAAADAEIEPTEAKFIIWRSRCVEARAKRDEFEKLEKKSSTNARDAMPCSGKMFI